MPRQNELNKGQVEIYLLSELNVTTQKKPRHSFRGINPNLYGGGGGRGGQICSVFATAQKRLALD